MTRLWPAGDPVQMQLDPTGMPQTFLWAGVWHPVAAIANRWRVQASWWAPDAAVWQEYVKLVTTDGLLCVMAHDLRSDGWRLIRLYD